MVVALVALVVGPRLAHAQERSCGARSDCRDGLRCLENVCVDAETFAASQPRITGAEGTQAFFGVAIGASLPMVWGTFGEASQLAARVGALINEHLQVELEVSPATTVLTGLTSSALGLFEVTASVGYLVRLNDMVSWILRFGGGGGAVFGLPTNTCGECPTSSAIVGFGEVRFDLVGVAIRTSKHLLVELNVPSFRILLPTSNNNSFEFGGNVMMMWMTNVAFNYMF
jgi:hypothetical protein